MMGMKFCFERHKGAPKLCVLQGLPLVSSLPFRGGLEARNHPAVVSLLSQNRTLPFVARLPRRQAIANSCVPQPGDFPGPVPVVSLGCFSCLAPIVENHALPILAATIK
jgi:hypothetical protein